MTAYKVGKTKSGTQRSDERTGEKPGSNSASGPPTTAKDGALLESLDNEVQLINRLKDEIRQDSKLERHNKVAGNPPKCSITELVNPNESKPKVTPENHSTETSTKVSLEESNDPEDSHPDDWTSISEQYKNIDSKAFRQYELACDRVKQFYEEQHEKQTVAYNIQSRINFKTKTRARMTIWEGLERLNKLLDDSDPDTELSQIDHALQTAEAIRRDNKPRWFQLVGLIHDLGKLLYFFDSKGQWDVVGDTFPVGCKFSKKIIFSNSFKRNPDFLNPLYNTKYGIYSRHCGLDKVMLSWGHDEYMYHIAKQSSVLPPEALAMIRYHSFYPWHQEYAYSYLMDEHDKEMLKAVKAFNSYDLYSKIDKQYDVEELKPYYLELIDEFFPTKVIDF